jgi:hypothetical protein
MNNTTYWSDTGTTTTTTTTGSNTLAHTRATSHRILILLHKLGLSCRALPEGMILSSLADNSLYVKTKTNLVRLSSMTEHSYYPGSSYAGSGGGVYQVSKDFWSEGSATVYPSAGTTSCSTTGVNNFKFASAWVEGTSRLKLDDEE